jgi:[histone H3]-lysine36 N-dimethyltransferase SETMAR
VHFRAMMFYDFKKGVDFKQCYESLVKVFGNEAPSRSQVHFWFKEFERGRQSLEDGPRTGRPSENIKRVEELIRSERNITVREIQHHLGIGLASVELILHEHLGVRKLVSRWVPHLLTADQKQARIDWCHFMIKKFDEGRSKRVNEIVTGDETWIYSYDPETKQQSTVWVFEEEPPPTKVVRDRSTSKQMVAVFFRRQGSLATVPLVERKTVNAQWYTEVCLPKVFDKLQEERPSAGLRGILLHHDNAPAHTAAATLNFLHDSGVQLVTHPPYSPDLAPCDFFLFPKAKQQLRGKRYESANAAVAALNDVLSDMPKKAFQDCFDKWFARMHMCICAMGEYFEKL